MSIALPQVAAVPAKFYRLRWRYEFFDGKATKIGIWDGSSNLPQDSAWSVNKENLAKAIIEGEDRQTFHTKEFLVIDGSEYVTAQWEVYSKAPHLGLRTLRPITLTPIVAGLSFLTREEKITCWVNGTLSRQPLSEQDKTWKIHEHHV